MIGKAQFPNIQHKASYPGSGAAGYEYCGLMMNVANIELAIAANIIVSTQ